jgi:hypothetical protein
VATEIGPYNIEIELHENVDNGSWCNESFRNLVSDVLATCFMPISCISYSSTVNLEAISKGYMM